MNGLIRKTIFIGMFLFMGACVDRISFDIGTQTNFPIVIEGFISNESGPYLVKIVKAFDIESKQSIKTPLSVRSVIVYDNHGYSEQLREAENGIYETSPTGIKGQIGDAYKIKVELLDGRIYESIPDTLKPVGTVDSVYHRFVEYENPKELVQYGFDVFFNSSALNSDAYYLWRFVGTYQVETNPELFEVSCGESKCPTPLPCSAYTLVKGVLFKSKNCECCTCWINFFNNVPILSDNRLIASGKFLDVKAQSIPINKWIFMHKVRAEIQQLSLSRRAFLFWKAVKDQKEATVSLFQPISGKVRGNFVQISGKPGPVEGLFYSAAIHKKSIYITRNDVKPQSIIPPQDLPFKNSCESLFPYSSAKKPSFWID